LRDTDLDARGQLRKAARDKIYQLALSRKPRKHQRDADLLLDAFGHQHVWVLGRYLGTRDFNAIYRGAKFIRLSKKDRIRVGLAPLGVFKFMKMSPVKRNAQNVLAALSSLRLCPFALLRGLKGFKFKGKF